METDSSTPNGAKNASAVNAPATGSEPPHWPWRRIIAWTLAILVLVFIALLTPIPFKGRFASALGDFVHAPLFGSLAFVWLWLWQRLRPLDASHSRSATAADGAKVTTSHPGRQFLYRGLAVWLVLSLFGAVMELLQSMFSRSGSWHDAQANSLGIAASILLCAGVWFYRHQRPRPGFAFGAAAALVLLIAWYPPYLLMTDVFAQRREFPLLGSFERSPEITRYYFRNSSGEIVHEHASDGGASMRIDYEAADWAVVTMVHLVHDWSAFESLKLDVRLDDAADQNSVELIIKIIDEPSRFQNDPARRVSFKLEPGKTHEIEIQLDELTISRNGKAFDPTRVQFLDLGIAGATKPTRLWIDHLRLTE